MNKEGNGKCKVLLCLIKNNTMKTYSLLK